MKAFVIISVFIITTVFCEIDPDSVTVGGLSAGGYMATQYQVAFSSEIKGAAVFAGGPYYCAQGVLTNALTRCMNGLAAIPLNTLEAYARQQAGNGLIDPVAGIASHAVYIFAGLNDLTVSPKVVQALEQMYRNWGVTNIETEYGLAASHTFPTLNYGNPCLVSLSPFISVCNYDGAGVSLNRLYGTLVPAVSQIPANILKFSQRDFTPNGALPASLSMHNDGYAYIPTACKPNSQTNSSIAVCRLHVSFHGCKQTITDIGLDWVESTGYNDWAESNNIIVVYPQAVSSFFSPSNPNGCWDWWGYLESGYATKRGPQMVTVNNMIKYFMENY